MDVLLPTFLSSVCDLPDLLSRGAGLYVELSGNRLFDWNDFISICGKLMTLDVTLSWWSLLDMSLFLSKFTDLFKAGMWFRLVWDFLSLWGILLSFEAIDMSKSHSAYKLWFKICLLHYFNNKYISDMIFTISFWSSSLLSCTLSEILAENFESDDDFFERLCLIVVWIVWESWSLVTLIISTVCISFSQVSISNVITVSREIEWTQEWRRWLIPSLPTAWRTCWLSRKYYRIN